jgi:1,4-alpha-glucan branching enzyme
MGAEPSGTMLPLGRETRMIKLSRTAKTVKVTFALPAEDAVATCSVVGDFNGWKPGTHQLRKRSNGMRSASVTLPKGTRVRFRYLGSNGHWFNDPDVAEFDGPDSVLVL